MPSTPVFGIPYPGPGDVPNVPADIYALAGWLENYLDDLDPTTRLAALEAIGAAARLTALEALHLSSGSYTPTVAGVANVASVTGHQSLWTQLGDIVTVTGRADVTPTTNANTTFTVSLPVPSNLGSTYDLSGTAVTGNAPLGPGTCVAETAADKATVRFVADNTTPNAITYQFSYKVI